ncbi:MAG TPA: hypothetical protein ENK84_07050 [Desulfobulbus sp.]|nr:hypothetical protein [Desulfobulbus sp.]
MPLIDEIKQTLAGYSGAWKEKRKGRYQFSYTVAERKVFLSTRRLVYTARFRINEKKKEIIFSEMLKESSSGLLAASGFGFKAESYNTLSRARKGIIEEQSRLFGRDYTYCFDFSEIRGKIEKIVRTNGYLFTYKIF